LTENVFLQILQNLYSKMVSQPDISKLIVVGDRVLIKPKSTTNKSRGGLYLPPGYKEKEELQTGYIVKAGPGYPIPLPTDNSDEPWKNQGDTTKYIPLQAKVGDLAIFMQKGAVEIQFRGEKYFIVPQHSILLLERDEELFD
jgi:co-chaperonin GroES (HSP10)